MDDSILEPFDLYNNKLKDLHHQNSLNYFDELVKKSKVNIEENRQTVKQIHQKKEELDKVNKKISKNKLTRSLLILCIVLLSIASIILLYLGFTKALDLWIGIVVTILSVLGSIGLILWIIKKINPIIKETDIIKQGLQNEIKDLIAVAYAQLRPLNDLFDWNMPRDIIIKTTPLLQMDKYFDAKKLQYLIEKYDLSENVDENVSTVFVQSGSILGNPFLICREYEQLWENREYTGSLTIHWTETIRGSDGKTQTVSRTQTLHASIVKPVPSYSFETYLIYGNEAAPNLKFSRKPSNIRGKSEKEIEKIVSQGAKRLDDLAEDAVKQNKNYTRLNNDEFEVLFGGENRNNEVEFRLLFTPLAQKNELKLIKSEQPYGDDFYFEKSGKLNFIQSRHSQNQDYYADPNQFMGYDIDMVKSKFVQYNDEYFKSLFFDLAPLISIPLYQQHKSREYIYKREYRANITSFEHEALANSFDINLFKHPKTDTNVILKTTFEKKDNEADRVLVRAHSFKKEARIDYVSVFGGDGRSHSVAVPWDKYIPIYQDSYIEVKAQESTRFDFRRISQTAAFKNFISKISKKNAYVYERGLMATLLSKPIDEEDLNKWNDLFKIKGNNCNSNISNQNNSSED